jgi:hypothetical protein
MPLFTVRQGRRYRATISLNWLEQFASNDMIAQQLANAGFAHVTVTGSGDTREAEAVWPGTDATAEIPSQVAAINEVEA